MGKVPRTDTGVALAAFGNLNLSGRHGGKFNQQPHMAKNSKSFGVCWACGGKGHVLRDCPSPLQPRGCPDKEKKKLEDSHWNGRMKQKSQARCNDDVSTTGRPGHLSGKQPKQHQTTPTSSKPSKPLPHHSSSGSVNAIAPFEEDGVWSTAN